MNARGDSPATDDVRTQVGDRIRQRRKQLGLSQTELGRRLVGQKGQPVPGTHISKWERGEYLPDQRQWADLAAALETTMDGIFGGLLVEAPDETLADRVTEVEARLEALIHLQRLGAGVDAVVKARRRPRLDLDQVDEALEAERIAREREGTSGAGEHRAADG